MPHARIVALVLALSTCAFAGEIPEAERRSGYDFMSRQTRAMQDDDATNPGMLWVLEGATLWKTKPDGGGRACADCHGDARQSMKGVAARHPAFDRAKQRPVSLEQRINACRVDRQQAPSLPHESRELLALTAYLAHQSRGLPIEIAIDERVRPFLEAGRATWERRQGQLNLACNQCHNDLWGKQLAGNVSPPSPSARGPWSTSAAPARWPRSRAGIRGIPSRRSCRTRWMPTGALSFSSARWPCTRRISRGIPARACWRRSAGRVTLMGRTARVSAGEREAVKAAYLVAQPNAAYWVDFEDFAFWRHEVEDVYFVGGFAAMGWVEAADYRAARPDPLAEVAQDIMEHMNRDHADALRAYARFFAGEEAEEARMVGVDRLGFKLYLRNAERRWSTRIAFPREATTAAESRAMLIEMVRQARGEEIGR